MGRPDTVPNAARVDEAEIGRIFREESGRSVATLTKIFGDIDVAEDAVQEAFAVALRKWASAKPRWMDHHDGAEQRHRPPAP
jgi:DNA-directed RNA polymerase specialized sigma24 family protein